MCGIIGVLNLADHEPPDPERLLEANNTLHHRGPDDEGMLVQPKIGMAMRRLSIIDVAGGHQPISNEDGTIQIVYNGEVYNHEDLRAELEALGHQFRTNSDTEAVLHAYEQWGAEGCLERLRGMYAFAIWDGPAQTLFLARDRMGIKPLYYIEYGGRFYFGSEIRGMLLHSGLPRQVNLVALEAFMAVGFVTSPHSIFKGVNKLPPAHYLLVRDGQISIHKYWELTYETTRARSSPEVVEEFRELLKESVDMHLMSEVPLGALLSGGIDSTTNVALIQESATTPLKTVTVGFEAFGYNEADAAALSARALGTDHRQIMFTGSSMDAYPRALYHREEPMADATFAAEYYLFKACREEGLTVVLTGEGADELLGGYYWHRGDAMTRPFLRMPYPVRMMLAASPWVRRRGEAGMRMGRILRDAPTAVHTRYQAWIRTGEPAFRNRLFSPQVKAALNDNDPQPILESWADHLSAVRGQSAFQQMLWLQSRTRLVERMNHSVDRMSMAHSIETRPPFLDHKLWEFCATIPDDLKLHGSFLNLVEKYILREATKDLIPEAVRLRKKKGLLVPYDPWLSQPRLSDWAEAALSETQLKKTGLFDPGAVLGLRRAHQAGESDTADLLMGVLAIQTWAHLFLESPLDSGPPQI